MLFDGLAWILAIVAIAMIVPIVVLFVQVVAAVWPAPAEQDFPNACATAPTPGIAVLVPAHDEAAGISATIRSLRAQLASTDRLLVVADNCTDETARIAAEAGAEVVERRNLAERGKSYALDHGVRHLEARPPEVVVIVDADCEVSPGSLGRLARRCIEARRPAQALYSMHAPAGAGLKARIAAFAWIVKNRVRPLGYHRLGLPCQLMGTGMAFPWALIRDAPLASGHIAEDLRLGLDLAASGAAPLFCPDAEVTSVFPTHPQGVADQRARWEHGHVSIVLHEAPRALWNAITERRPEFVALVLDLSVPPLSIVLMILVLQAAVDLVFFAAGGTAVPLGLALIELAMLAVAISVAWARFGRHVLSSGELLGIPLYVLGKLPIYARFFKRGKREWVRARRDDPDD